MVCMGDLDQHTGQASIHAESHRLHTESCEVNLTTPPPDAVRRLIAHWRARAMDDLTVYQCNQSWRYDFAKELEAALESARAPRPVVLPQRYRCVSLHDDAGNLKVWPDPADDGDIMLTSDVLAMLKAADVPFTTGEGG